MFFRGRQKPWPGDRRPAVPLAACRPPAGRPASCPAGHCQSCQLPRIVCYLCEADLEECIEFDNSIGVSIWSLTKVTPMVDIRLTHSRIRPAGCPRPARRLDAPSRLPRRDAVTLVTPEPPFFP
jgi:hypothetical protein